MSKLGRNTTFFIRWVDRYRFGHNIWDFNDDLKLFESNCLKVKERFLFYIQSFNGILYDLLKKNQEPSKTNEGRLNIFCV